MSRKYVILGNGIAGFSAAKKIREMQSDAEITMVSEETETSYLRPLLSKTGFRTFQADRIRLTEDVWYHKWNIRQILGVGVDWIDGKNHQAFLQDGTKLSYDACIYALGATCFVPPFQGKDQNGVVTVRTNLDFDRIRSLTALAERAVVIGGGVIGLEMAWEIARLGIDVTILEAGPRLMGRLLDDQSAEVLTQRIQNQKITCHAGVQITELTGTGQVNGVRLSDGRFFPADFVIVSCGVRANTSVAQKSGIDCDRGVLVNDELETNVEDVFAAGDCMQWKEPNPGLWNYARVAGEFAGYNAATDGKKRKFGTKNEPVILSAMGTSLFSMGNIEEDGQEKTVVGEKKKLSDQYQNNRFRVNIHEGEYPAYAKRFYRDGKLCGAVLIGDLSDMNQIKAEIKKKG